MEIVILKNRNIMSISESLIQEIGCFVRVSAVSNTYIICILSVTFVCSVCILINWYYVFYNFNFT